MKISDGQWLIREGLEVASSAHVHDVQVRGRELHVLLAPRDVSDRAGQLDCPLLTLRIYSPRTGVIGVRLEHFQGAPPARPAFALAEEERPEVEARVDEGEGTLRSGELTARVRRGPGGGLEILRGDTPLTGVEPRGQGYAVERATGRAHVFARLGLAVGENVYGLGERFTAFVKNGQAVEIWNADGGTASEQAYKNVPFYLTNRGYGVLRRPPGPRLVRGRLRAGRRGAVQRRGRAARVLRHLRPHAQGGAATGTPRSPAGPRCRRPGRSACGCRPRSPPTTTRRP